MPAKGNTREIVGILATLFFFVGLIVCSNGWLNGRWLILFIGLPFVVVVLPETVLSSWRGPLHLLIGFLVICALALIVVVPLSFLEHNRWLNAHRWAAPILQILLLCAFVKFIVNRKPK